MSATRLIEQGQRILQLRQKIGFSQGDFAEIMGIQQSTLSTIEKGKNGISLKSLELLIDKFQIDPSWLLTGATTESHPSLEVSALYGHKEENRGNLIAEKGNLIGQNGGQTLSEAVSNAGEGVPSDLMHESEQVNVPGMPKGAIIVKVAGSSMAPNILDQDYVACLPVKERSALRYNEPHLVITTQSMLYVKRLRLHSTGFELSSDNKEYPSIYVGDHEIAQLYYVVGRITTHIATAANVTMEDRLRRIEESFEALFTQNRKA